MNVTAAPALRKSCDVRMWNDIVLSFLNLSSVLFTYVAYFIRFSIQSDKYYIMFRYLPPEERRLSSVFWWFTKGYILPAIPSSPIRKKFISSVLPGNLLILGKCDSRPNIEKIEYENWAEHKNRQISESVQKQFNGKIDRSSSRILNRPLMSQELIYTLFIFMYVYKFPALIYTVKVKSTF